MILLIGLLFSVMFTFIFAIMLGGNAGYIIDPGCMLMILIPVIFFLCVTSGGKAIGRYIKKSFSKKPHYDEAELKQIAAAAKSAMKVTIAAGCFMFLLGMTTLLFHFNFDDPNAINIFGKNLSAGLISLLYAVATAYFVFYPLQVWAEHKAIDVKHSESMGTVPSLRT